MEFKDLIKERKELKYELKENKIKLIQLVNELPIEVIHLWADGVIKFNFSLPIHFRKELLMRIQNN